MATSLSIAEWRALVGLRPNVLIIGNPELTAGLVSELVALAPSVYEWIPHGPLPKPTNAAALFVLRDLSKLSLARQDRWIDWLDRAAAPRPQILATSSVDVWPLVTRGVFRSALYYRVNTVLLTMRRMGSARPSPAQVA